METPWQVQQDKGNILVIAKKKRIENGFNDL